MRRAGGGAGGPTGGGGLEGPGVGPDECAAIGEGGRTNGPQRELRGEHDVDVTTRAELDFAGGPATLTCSMKPERFGATLKLTGENGTLEIANYLAPQMGCRFTVTVNGVERKEPTAGDATYVAQLKELGDVLLRGKSQLITNADSLGNMTAIDAIYAAAGVERVFEV